MSGALLLHRRQNGVVQPIGESRGIPQIQPVRRDFVLHRYSHCPSGRQHSLSVLIKVVGRLGHAQSFGKRFLRHAERYARGVEALTYFLWHGGDHPSRVADPQRTVQYHIARLRDIAE